MIWQNGGCLAPSERKVSGARSAMSSGPTALRAVANGYLDGIRRRRPMAEHSLRRRKFALDPPADNIGLRREIERFPLVPADPLRLQHDCYEAYHIQVSVLEQRLRALKYPKIKLGLSRLDSGVARAPRCGPHESDATSAVSLQGRGLDESSPSSCRCSRARSIQTRGTRADRLLRGAEALGGPPGSITTFDRGQTAPAGRSVGRHDRPRRGRRLRHHRRSPRALVDAVAATAAQC